MTPEELYITILNSNIINFTIMVSILVFIFKKFNLGKIFDDITDDIRKNVVSSAEATKNALNKYKEAKKELKTADSKKQAIIEDAKLQIEKITLKNESDIIAKKADLDDVQEKTKEVMTQRMKEKVAHDFKDAIYTLSIDVIKENLTEDESFASIKTALDELDNFCEVKF